MVHIPATARIAQLDLGAQLEALDGGEHVVEHHPVELYQHGRLLCVRRGIQKRIGDGAALRREEGSGEHVGAAVLRRFEVPDIVRDATLQQLERVTAGELKHAALRKARHLEPGDDAAGKRAYGPRGRTPGRCRRHHARPPRHATSTTKHHWYRRAEPAELQQVEAHVPHVTMTPTGIGRRTSCVGPRR